MLRYIELSKFQQPESNKIFVEAGLLQLFICNFCSQLIFLNFQRFQTLFRCPGVQAILDGLHQVVQLFVDLSQLLFQQRDRCVLLILYIHDQLNDLVDHHIVLNQLHGLPDDQIFQPFFLHGLFVAALAPLDVGALVIIVGAPSGTGSAFAEHQCTALAAEQLGGQQVFFVGFAAGRGALVLVHTLLHPVKQVFRNDSRNRIRHNDIPERQFTNVTTVLQHGVHAAVGHFAVLHIADTLVVEEVYDFHHPLAVVILLKGFQHKRSSQRVKVIKLVLVDFIANGSRTAGNATATALNCISQICCFHVALISCLAIKVAIILRSSNSGLPTADPPCGCTIPSGRTALPGCPVRPRCRPTAPPPDPHRLQCASGGR